MSYLADILENNQNNIQMKNLLEKLNTGILEEKGIWKEHLEPNTDEKMAAWFNADFLKEYKAPNGYSVFYVSFCGQESITVLDGTKVLKRIKDKVAVEKQVSFLDKIQFIGNVTIERILR